MLHHCSALHNRKSEEMQENLQALKERNIPAWGEAPGSTATRRIALQGRNTPSYAAPVTHLLTPLF